MTMERYAKYKDSGVDWIGEIPDGWNITPLKHIVNVIYGFPFDAKNFNNQGHGKPLIRIRDITSGTTETSFDGDYPDYSVVHRGDVLIGMDGDFNVRVWSGSEALLNQRCCKVLGKGLIHDSFLAFCLPFALKQINDLKYATTVKHLSDGDINNIALPLPSIPIQQAIVAYLEEKTAAIDAAVADVERSIELLNEYCQSVISEAVTKGLDPNAPMKDSGIDWIGEIPEGWHVEKAKYLVRITNGSDPKTKGTIPVYGSGTGSFKTCGESKDGPTVLIGRKGATLHIPHYITGKYWNVDTAFDVKPIDDNMNLRYYYYLATCFDYKQHMSQTTLPSMTQSAYWNMPLPTPDRKTQNQIVDYLDKKCSQLDALIDQKQSLLVRLKEYRSSLISECVTGKVKVPGVKED